MKIKDLIKRLNGEWIQFRRVLLRRTYVSSKTERDVVDSFHKLYYDSELFGETGAISWLGVKTVKCPMDLWVYQEMIFEMKPDVIIETGTNYGGSAYYLASICDMVNNGKIITIDVRERENRPEHGRIKYLSGSSVSSEIVGELKSLITDTDKVMVILDSDHSKEHVLKEMEIYSDIVTGGSYMIVEDTNMNGHPVLTGWGPGPMEAVVDFFKVNNSFIVDKSREKFYLTYNPKGYLKKVG